MSWAVVKESTVLSYLSNKKAGHARTPILLLRAPSTLSGGIPVTVITTFRLVLLSQRQSSGIIWRTCKICGNEDNRRYFAAFILRKSLEENLEIKRLGPEPPPGTLSLDPAGGLPSPCPPVN
ncbi:hypothetical protein PoB_004610900 [Plakobranchus ocellatus]|uniref:Uncharacterized protein n=1 Tax=Plakobranchus ocellatus TaxID=259542 RepID=A0AAV4BMN5_9GAST|nr:hypothetical protein PoB_004610900 [Plakobranchus ocellatus]